MAGWRPQFSVRFDLCPKPRLDAESGTGVMGELVLLIPFCFHFGALARAKGYRPGFYRVMPVAFWFAGEFGTGYALTPLTAALSPDASTPSTWVHMLPLAGAVAGLGLAYLIMLLLPPAEGEAELAGADLAGPGRGQSILLDSDNPYASPRT